MRDDWLLRWLVNACGTDFYVDAPRGTLVNGPVPYKCNMNSLTVISFFKKNYAFASQEDEKGWREPVEFLSIHPSKGPNEEKDPYSEFASYDGADLDIKFFACFKTSET